MKKILASLLLCAAALAATAGSPKQIIDKHLEYAAYGSPESYIFYDLGGAKVQNGMVTSMATEDSWRQFIIADGLKFEVGRKYTVTLNMKKTGYAPIDVVLGNWDASVKTTGIFAGDEWGDVVIELPEANVESGHLLIQMWSPANQGVQIKSVTLSHEGYLKTVKTAYTTPEDYQFLGYGSDYWTLEKTTFDNRPCFHATCTGGEQNFWFRQAIVDADLNYGTRYYFDFDVNSDTTAVNINTAFRDGGSDAGNYNLVPGWQKVYLAGAPEKNDETKEKANAFVLHLGRYTGNNLYISNLHIKKEVATADEADPDDVNTGLTDILAPSQAIPGVYNLQGVRVASDLNAPLPAGLYIVGGKKVVIR